MSEAAQKKTIKVLHILGSLNRGGAEVWLLNLIKCLSTKEFETHVLLNSIKTGDLEEEYKSNGAKIHKINIASGIWQYTIGLWQTLGLGVDAVHSHVHFFSGWILFIAYLRGVKVRIAHSHTNEAIKRTLKRTLYEFICRKLISIFSTHNISVSNFASLGLFGSTESRKLILIPPGINARSFAVGGDTKMRLQSNNKLSIGQIGSLIPVKNHAFTFSILKVLQIKIPDVKLHVLGAGILNEQLKNQVKGLGLEDNVIFEGSVGRIIPFLNDVIDVILHPSIAEGLPVALLEAQASGTHVFYSDTIDQQVEVIPSLMHRLSLDLTPEMWAETIFSEWTKKKLNKASDSYSHFIGTPFDVTFSADKLSKVYRGMAS